MSSNPSLRSVLSFAVGLLLSLALAYGVYQPGLSGPLVFDDYANLQALEQDGGIDTWGKAGRFVFGNQSGPAGRPLVMASFLLDAQDWPPRVDLLKRTNLMIHLLCGLLVCWVSLLLGRALGLAERSAAPLGLLTAAVWLLHPLASTTTLYVIQRMAQLMTLFSLAGLVCYLKGRMALTSGRPQAWVLLCASLFPLGLLAVLSKENGALLLLVIVALEHTVFSAVAAPTPYRWWYRIGVLLPVAVLFVGLVYMTLGSGSTYAFREFSLSDRVLTETRILWRYLSRILLPNAVGVGIYHDDLEISRSLIQPLTTLPALVGLLALFAGALRWRRDQPVLALAIFWFLGTHVMESTTIPLELYFEHRNYLPMIGPLFALVWYGRLGWLRLQSELAKRATAVVVGAVLALTVWQTAQVASIWGDTNGLFAYWVFEKPGSFRARWTYASFLEASGNPQMALDQLAAAIDLRPTEVTAYLYAWNMACENGLTPPISVAGLVARQDLTYHINNVNALLRTFLENRVIGRCPYPSEADQTALFERLLALPQEPVRLASFYAVYSDLFVLQGNLDQALIQLSRAFALRPDAQIPIRQALLSASAGNFTDALVFLERARTADAARRPFFPSAADEIERLATDFNRQLTLTGR